MKNRFLIGLVLILIFVTYAVYADEIEIYKIQTGPGEVKTFKYKPNKEVTVAMAIARAGYAGKYCWFDGKTTEEAEFEKAKVKEDTMKRLGLTEKELDALVKQ